MDFYTIGFLANTNSCVEGKGYLYKPQDHLEHGSSVLRPLPFYRLHVT